MEEPGLDIDLGKVQGEQTEARRTVVTGGTVKGHIRRVQRWDKARDTEVQMTNQVNWWAWRSTGAAGGVQWAMTGRSWCNSLSQWVP